MAATQDGKAKSKKGMTPRQTLIWGAFCLVLSVVAYFYLHNAEQTGGTVTLPIIVIPVYDAIGTWGIVGILVVLGLLGLLMGALELREAARRSAALPHAEQVQQPGHPDHLGYTSYTENTEQG